jgi:hypothetical protein
MRHRILDTAGDGYITSSSSVINYAITPASPS